MKTQTPVPLGFARAECTHTLASRALISLTTSAIWFVLPCEMRAEISQVPNPVSSGGAATTQTLSVPPGPVAQPAPSAAPTNGQPAAGAPPLVNATLGLSFEDDYLLHSINGGASGAAHIPADPHGAVGPNHLVSVVNTSIRWSRIADEVIENSQRLDPLNGNAAGAFFASQFDATNSNDDTFDPRVVYDQHNGRFIVVALARTGTAENQIGNHSRILIAVSDDADPNGVWRFAQINARTTINSGGTNRDTFADYPCVGLDGDAVYITANMIPFGTGVGVGSRLWIVRKTELYSGAGISSTVHNPIQSAPVTNTEQGVILQPAHVFGAAGVNGGAAGTFLVSAGWNDPADSGRDYLLVQRINNPLPGAGQTTTFTSQFVNLGGSVDETNPITGIIPEAPQQGTNQLLRTGNTRAQNAVWRNNRLYTCNTVVPPAATLPAVNPDAGEATVRWYVVDVQLASGWTIAGQGNIGGETIAPHTSTFFPSIMADAAGNIGIGFSASASTIYPSAYFTGRLVADAAGSTRPPGAAAVGEDFYFRTFSTASNAVNRWGDYSAMALDPEDESTF